MAPAPVASAHPALRVRHPLIVALIVFAASHGAARAADDGVAPGWSAQRWTTEDGLPVNGLTGFAQTPDGFLWIATSGGLVRFDGLEFVVLGGPLTNARLTQIEVGPGGRLFVASEADVLYSVGPRGIVEHPLRLTGMVRRGDELWIGTDSGLLRALEDGFEPIGPPVPSGVVTAAYDMAGQLWIGSGHQGLWRVEGGWTVSVPLPEPTPRTVYDLQAAADGMWVGSDVGVHHIGPDGARHIPTGRQPPSVFGLVATPDGGVLATGYGLWRLGPGPSFGLLGDSGVHPLVEQPTAVHEARLVTRRADGLWLGEQPLLAGEQAAVATTDDGSIWSADFRGTLTRLQRQSIEALGGPGARCNAYGMRQDRAGDLYVGCLVSGTLRFDRAALAGPAHRAAHTRLGMGCLVFTEFDGRLLCAYDDPAVIVDGRRETVSTLREQEAVRALFTDRRGVLWSGGREGLRRLWPDGRTASFTDARGDAIQAVVAAHEAADGQLWFSSLGAGLVRVDRARETVTRFGNAEGLPSRRIRSMLPATGGGFWLGSEDRGLLHATFVEGRARVVEIHPRDGLFADHVHRVLPDGRGRLWMSSNQGIFWAEERALLAFVAGERDRVETMAYGTGDGMPHREANGGAQDAGLVLRDGRLVFPTQAGVAVIDPRRIERDMRPPRVHIDRVEVGDTRVLERLTGAVAVDGPLRLTPDQRDFAVTYTAPVFRDPERVSFRYRLEGFDDHWIEAGGRRQAFYTRVPPGRYRFRVTAANAHHVWHPEGVTLDIEVVPRFFETWWFGALGLLAGVGLLLGLIRLRFARIQARAAHLEEQVALRTAELARQAQALEALDELKTRFFAHISHELRTPLTLIAGAVEQLPDRDDGGTTDALRRNTRRLRRLTDQILALLRGEAGLRQVNLEPVDLAALARATIAAFAPVAERVQLAVRGAGVALAHPELIETVLVNLISNAVKFTDDGGRITVDIGRVGAIIRLTVEDDGRGIPADDLPRIFDRFYRVESATLREGEGTGLGLALVRELVVQQGGEIRAESTLGEGSRFIVELPASEEPAAAHPWGGQGADEASLLPGAGPRDDVADDRPRVLVVDDNADLRRWVGRALADDFAVLYAEDGEQGVARAREALPDLIVADVMMPRLDGFGLVRALADDRETDCVPVLLLTARASPAAELTGLRAGAVDFMTKPFDVEILRARARSIIGRRARLRDALRAEIAAAAEAPAPVPAADAAPAATVQAQARAVIEARIDDPELNLPTLARALGMSRTTLARRLAEEAAPTPAALIREVRLERARALLADGRGNVSEVAYAVGFNSHAHFTRRFKARFGVPPSRLISAA